MRIYEKTLKSIMRKYLENSAYVTIFLKKTTRNFSQKFGVDFEGILWNS